MVRKVKGSIAALLVTLCLLAAGCQSDSNLPVDQDKAMRGKLNEGLSPAEIEKYFGKDGLKGKGPSSAPTAPPKTGG